MKNIHSTRLLSVHILHLISPIHGLQPWCGKHLEGFTLADNYNPNSPPSRDFTLQDLHVLSQVDEVRRLCTDINF